MLIACNASGWRMPVLRLTMRATMPARASEWRTGWRLSAQPAPYNQAAAYSRTASGASASKKPLIPTIPLLEPGQNVQLGAQFGAMGRGNFHLLTSTRRAPCHRAGYFRFRYTTCQLKCFSPGQGNHPDCQNADQCQQAEFSNSDQSVDHEGYLASHS